MKKWTIWIGIVIILAAAGAGAYYYYFAQEKEGDGDTPVAQTVTATKGSIVNQISGTGSVAANTRETLTAGKSETIAEVHVKKGDKVKAGQTIVTFEDSDDYEDQIETIQENKEKLQDTIEGYQEDYKAAIGTENEEETKEKIQKSIEDAHSQLADLEDDLEDIYEEQSEQTKLVAASIDGEITEFDIEAGDEVQANTTIATIVDYTKLEFVTSVDELDIPSLKVGQAVDITLSSITDRTIDATVSEIAREGTSSNGASSFEVSILLTDIEGVMAGMSGEAAITIESKEDIVLVPVNAVVEMGGKSFVRVPSTGEEGAATTGGQQSAGRGQGAWSGEGGPMGEGGAPPADGAAQGGDGAPEDGQAPSGEAAAGEGQAPSGSGTAAEGQAPAGGGASAGDAQAPTGEGGASTGTGQRPTGGTGGAASSERQNMRAAMMESLTLGGQLLEVTTGLSNDAFVEIVSGLNEGDSVLIPIASGTVGMGGSGQETEVQMQGFPGGGFPGGGFQMGGGGFQMEMGGGGAVRSSSGGGMGGGGMR